MKIEQLHVYLKIFSRTRRPLFVKLICKHPSCNVEQILPEISTHHVTPALNSELYIWKKIIEHSKESRGTRYAGILV